MAKLVKGVKEATRETSYQYWQSKGISQEQADAKLTFDALEFDGSEASLKEAKTAIQNAVNALCDKVAKIVPAHAKIGAEIKKVAVARIEELCYSLAIQKEAVRSLSQLPEKDAVKTAVEKETSAVSGL